MSRPKEDQTFAAQTTAPDMVTEETTSNTPAMSEADALGSLEPLNISEAGVPADDVTEEYETPLEYECNPYDFDNEAEDQADSATEDTEETAADSTADEDANEVMKPTVKPITRIEYTPDDGGGDDQPGPLQDIDPYTRRLIAQSVRIYQCSVITPENNRIVKVQVRAFVEKNTITQFRKVCVFTVTNAGEVSEVIKIPMARIAGKNCASFLMNYGHFTETQITAISTEFPKKLCALKVLSHTEKATFTEIYADLCGGTYTNDVNTRITEINGKRYLEMLLSNFKNAVARGGYGFNDKEIRRMLKMAGVLRVHDSGESNKARTDIVLVWNGNRDRGVSILLPEENVQGEAVCQDTASTQ